MRRGRWANQLLMQVRLADIVISGLSRGRQRPCFTRHDGGYREHGGVRKVLREQEGKVCEGSRGKKGSRKVFQLRRGRVREVLRTLEGRGCEERRGKRGSRILFQLRRARVRKKGRS